MKTHGGFVPMVEIVQPHKTTTVMTKASTRQENVQAIIAATKNSDATEVRVVADVLVQDRSVEFEGPLADSPYAQNAILLGAADFTTGGVACWVEPYIINDAGRQEFHTPERMSRQYARQLFGPLEFKTTHVTLDEFIEQIKADPENFLIHERSTT